MADWSLSALQLKLIKIGASVVRLACAVTFNWPKLRSQARWWRPSLPRPADCARHRYAWDWNPDTN